MREQPSYDPQPVWREGGAAANAGIAGDVVWIREDAEGREIQRGVHEGALPVEGAEVARSPVDGRPWLVHAIEKRDGRVALHLRKGGEAETSRLGRHRMSAPPPTPTV